MLLLALRHLEPSAFRIHAVSVPRGQVYEALSGSANVETIPMELGGSEARRSSAGGRLQRAREAAVAFPRIVSLIMSRGIDVIVTIDRTVAAHLAQAASRLTGRPFVLSAHYPFYPATSAANRLVVRQATRVIVHSEYLAAQLRPFVGGPERLVTLPNAVEIDRYRPDGSGASVRRDLGIGPATPLVVMAGRLSQFKGQEDLIRAAALVRIRHPEVRIFIAGRDTGEFAGAARGASSGFKARLQRLIDELGVGGQVTLLGYYPDLPALIGAADVMAMPSWEEPFGLVALEAMASGKPVVATAAGGVPEFVLDGETGLLVPPREPSALAAAIGELLADPDRSRAMGRRGRDHVEARHTAPMYADGMARALRGALSERPARSFAG